MSTFFDAMREFIVHYPVLPPFFFVLCAICAVPVIILLIATQKCPLHPNCRYLITFWSISLLGILANTCQLQIQMLFYDKGFVPRGFYGGIFWLFIQWPTLRARASVERIRSTFRPQEYHESGASWAVLIVLTIFAYSLGAYVGFLIYLNDHHFTGFIIYNAIDISTLVTNTLGIWYCKKRYKMIYGKASLNARYQVNEAYEMARAMHPVYFGSFLLKAVGMAIAYSYGFMMKLINGPVFALLDSGYFMLHALNCAYASGFLMRNHMSLRKAALKLMPWKRPLEAPVAPLGCAISDTTNHYFNMLEDSWK